MKQAKFPEIRVDKNGKKVIFDILRQRYVALTPEEGVRQGFIHFLINEKHFPPGLLANEVPISLNGTSKRCDSVLYNQHLQPIMIIEYKAPHINITQDVFNQIARYNMVLHVEYLIVTNSKQTYICRINSKTNEIYFLNDIPDYTIL